MLKDRLARRLRSLAASLDGAPSPKPAGKSAPLPPIAEELLQLQAEGRTGLVAARGRRGEYLARVVTRSTAQQAIDDNVDQVVARLDAAGVPYFLVAHRIAHRAVVGVLDSDRPAAVAALGGGETDDDFGVAYLAQVDRKRVLRETRADGAGASLLADEPVLRFFEVTATAKGTLLGGPDEGCDVEFWSLDPDAGGGAEPAWVAPRANIFATTLRLEHRVATTVKVRGRTFTTYPPFLVDHAFEIAFPIDAVYTWVDGQDPVWRARKEQARVGAGIDANALSVRPSRYTSRDELRYSLRSLDQYAEWIRTVYIITDDQVPEWLDTSNPRVQVVSHQEAFGDLGVLPTFNSHAIETKLHHLDGLSEHFLYLNDDVFFGRPVTPETFFESNGMPKLFPSPAQFGSGPVTAEDIPVDAAGKNNRDVLTARFGRTVTSKFKHAPHALRRSIATEVEQEFVEHVSRTAGSQFRSATDIAMVSLTHYVAWFTQRATIGRIRYEYVNMSVPESAERLDRLRVARDTDAFCLNDTDTDKSHEEQQALLLHDFLTAYFPLPSSFELSSGTPGTR
jgi:hypothetical protein